MITTFRAPPPEVPASEHELAPDDRERPAGVPEVDERLRRYLRSSGLVEPALPTVTTALAMPCMHGAGDGSASEVYAGAGVRAATDSSIAMVQGTFQVPSELRLSTPGGDQHASFWVGVDNKPLDPLVSATSLVQAGVQCDVDAHGNVGMYPWWEWVPGPLVPILGTSAKPGDSIQVRLTITSTTTASLELFNINDGHATTLTVEAPSGNELRAMRALWIAERPKIGDTPSELAAFEPVSFNNCVAMSHTGINGIIDKQTLDETSPVAPALASIGGFLFIAWKGDGNNALNLIASTDGGRTFGDKLTLAETTTQPPALCTQGGRLFLAWSAERTDQLHVAEVMFHGTRIDGLSSIVSLSETSPLGPALASLAGRLYLAWKGDGNDFLNIAVQTDNAPGFTHKHIFAETSSRAPALCALGPDLFLAWSSSGTDQLQVARVAIAGDTITGLATTSAVPETSQAGPALAAVDGRLALAWRTDGNNLLDVAYADPVSLSFHDKLVSRERSPVAPALVATGPRLVIGWKGDGNNSLNVATVQSAGPTLTALPLTMAETFSMSAPHLLAYACVDSANTLTCSYGGPRLDPYQGLTETTPDSPALAALDGRLFLGWKGDGNDALNLAFSDDAGSTFGHKVTTDVDSRHPPALSALVDDLFMAWTEPLDNQIHVGRVAMSGAGITDIVDRVPLGETTQASPTLAAIAGRLFVAFRGDGDDRLYILHSDDRGRTFGHRFASTETTRSSPVLFSDGLKLEIAWRGTDDRLNLAHVDIAADSITGLSGKVTLDEHSPASVAATAAGGARFLAWKGLGNEQLNFTTDGFARGLPEKWTALERSQSAPALCSDGSSVFVAWRDAGDQITVAQVQFSQPGAEP